MPQRPWLSRLRKLAFRDEPPRLADESRWYTEHTALLISTLKWALLGAGAGVCVGLGTRAFLWSLARSAELLGKIFGQFNLKSPVSFVVDVRRSAGFIHSPS